MSTPPPLSSIADLTEEPAILIDRDFCIVSANKAYQDRYGLFGTLRGRHCYEVSHGNKVRCDKAGEECPVMKAWLSGKSQRALHIHHSPHGDEHVDVEARPIMDDAGEPQFFMEIIRNTALASTRPGDRAMVGRSPAFMEMLNLVQRVAPSDVSALLLGESGTGKELVAQAIHDQSARAKGNFVPVECSGLTESLFESELFGHEKGAFTGAQYEKIGLVEAAEGGTLFLDEVGDIPLPLQVKLLRLLESGTYRRVGSTQPRHADFRLVCATHQDLEGMVAKGEFRRDLYYRISAFPIVLPSLRERLEDIPLLAETLLARLPTGQHLSLAPETIERLQQYNFPGNVRELRNILERASLMAVDEVILPEHLPPLPEKKHGITPQHPARREIVTLAEAERRYLRWALEQHPGDRRSLARKLGVSERTLFRKLQRLDAAADDESPV